MKMTYLLILTISFLVVSRVNNTPDKQNLNRLAELIRSGAVAGFLRTSALVATILLLSACGTKVLEGPTGIRPESQASGTRPPIALEVLRNDIEHHESWGQSRKAACPRRIQDRNESRQPFPAINILQQLKYIKISDDTSGGVYEKEIELTDNGRRAFANYLEEKLDRYVIMIARRQYLGGFERFETPSGRDNTLVVSFKWYWKPLNPLGERLNLWAPDSNRREHQGRAKYVRTGHGWELDDLWLESDNRDYVRGVYK